MLSWDMQWNTIRAASRVSVEGRDRVMRQAHRSGVLSLSHTRRILAGEDRVWS